MVATHTITATGTVTVMDGMCSLYDGLVAYWPLDETGEAPIGDAYDTMGEAKTFTQGNDPGTAAGKTYATARHFTKTSTEYFSRANDADLAGGADFTWMGWFYLDTSPGESPNYYMMWASESGVTGWNVGLVDNGVLEAFFQSIPDGTAIHDSSWVGNETGAWHLVIVWYNDATTTAYISTDNGEAHSLDVAEQAASVGTHYIGRQAGGQYMDGRLQSFAFWNRVLTAGERAALWNSGNGWAI